MEAPMRILNPANLNRHISTTFFFTKSIHRLTSNPHNLSPPPPPSPSLLLHSRNRSHLSLSLSSKTLTHANVRSATCFSSTFPNASSLGFFFSLSSFSLDSQPCYYLNDLKFNADDGRFFNWHKSSDHMAGAGAGVSGGKCEMAAVVLGWLGARPKHLRRYAELYTSRGIDAITFVVPVKDVLWFDLGRKAECRIRALANELISWLSEESGRDRSLIFHTFSSTGWLVYGAILGHLQDRPGLIEKIRACIVDSGGDPELHPKVWAAGFAAALLQKRNPAMSPLAESAKPSTDKNQAIIPDKEPDLAEAALLLFLESLFRVLFKLPDVNRRFSRIISILSDNPPPCPQLYLYSTADKVIPYQSVESFIEYQKMKGRTVRSFNFRSSPHVDHYRTFPDVYCSQVNSFLDEVLTMEKQV